MAIHKYLPSEMGVNEYLKKDGHTLSDSINEIIDNAIDQKASRIGFNLVNHNDKTYLLIENDGNPVVSWKSFLTLGGNSDRSKDSIGHYGVGLKQFLSLFKTHTVFSFDGKIISGRKKIQGNQEFSYDDEIDKNSFEYKRAKDQFKGKKSGILVILQISNEDVADWDDEEIYKKSAQSYFFCESIKIYFKNKEVRKTHPFGGLNLIKEIPLPGFEGLSLSYQKTTEGNATRGRRGVFLLFRGRLINSEGKYWFNHEEYNGNILLLSIDSWHNSCLADGSVSVVNQKNDFSLNKRNDLYKAIHKEVELLRSIIPTSNKKKQNLKKQLKEKNVLSSVSLPKGLVKTDEGNIVEKSSGKIKGAEMSYTDLERYLEGEVGTTLKKVYGHENRIDSGRYFKSLKKLELVIKIEKNVEQELKTLFYDLAISEEFTAKTKISIVFAVAYSKNESSKEINKIKERLKSKGVLFP